MITGPHHAWNEYQAKSGDSGGAGAGDRPPECGHGHSGNGKAAGKVAGQRFHKPDNAGGNAGSLHDVAGKYEEWYGQKREFGNAGKEVVGEHVHAEIPFPDHHQGGESKGQGYGHAKDKRNNEKRQEPEGGVIKKGCIQGQLPPDFYMRQK